jgi:radical SAM enzyme (TIGR01210 family)
MQTGKDITGQILKGTDEANKTYTFDEDHPNDRPSMFWFQESHEGLILFIVFYTQACRWSRCLACNLPSLCSKFPVGYKDIRKQIDWIFSRPEIISQREKIRKAIVSNNGSVLDQETFSSNALMYFTLMANEHLPNLRVLSLETRPEYVELAELEFLSRAIKEGDTPTELELAVGFEIFDDRLRNDVLHKGLRKETFVKLAAEMAEYRFRLKVYMMQKPVPGMSDEEAICDIEQAAAYFGAIVRRHFASGTDEPCLKIDLHLNPTYVARGTALEQMFLRGDYTPPHLRHVARAVLGAENEPISVYVGLSDEGLSVPSGSFLRPEDEPIRAALERFNILQDYDIIRGVLR